MAPSWPTLGHGRREVAEVAAAAVERCTYVVPPFATEDRVNLVDPAALLASAFADARALYEWRLGIGRSGPALGPATPSLRGRPERWKVMGTDLSYHGVSLGALSWPTSHPGCAVRADAHSVPKTPALHCPGYESGEHPADALERRIIEGPETVAAFIC